MDVLADIIQSVMDTYTRFMPYLQQYHTMLVNDLNEPSSDTPSQTPGGSSSSGGSTSGGGGGSNGGGQGGSASSTTPSSGESTPNTPSGNYGPNVIVIGGADNRRQRFFNNINDMMHLMAHLMHNISDLHVNIRDRPPRQMHTMSSMTNSGGAHSAATLIGAGGGAGGHPVGARETTIHIPIVAQLGPNGFQIQHAPAVQITANSAPHSTQATTTPTTVAQQPSSTTTSSSTAQSTQSAAGSAAQNQSNFFNSS